MEIVKITISLELFEKLFNEGHIKSGDYELNKVDEKDFDYSEDEAWQELKKASGKAYRKLQDYQYKLRHEKK